MAQIAIKGIKKLNQLTSPELLDNSEVPVLENMVLSAEDGVAIERNGFTIYNTNSLGGIVSLHDVVSGANDYLIGVAGAALYASLHGTGPWTSLMSGLTSGLKTKSAVYSDKIFVTNGIDKPIVTTITNTWNPGLPAPDIITSGLSMAFGSQAGYLTDKAKYLYLLVYATAAGELSAISIPFTMVSTATDDLTVDSTYNTNKSIQFTNLPVSANPSVTNLYLYRTTANGSVFYFLQSLANGTTSFTDTLADTALDTSNPITTIIFPLAAKYVASQADRIFWANVILPNITAPGYPVIPNSPRIYQEVAPTLTHITAACYYGTALYISDSTAGGVWKYQAGVLTQVYVTYYFAYMAVDTNTNKLYGGGGNATAGHVFSTSDGTTWTDTITTPSGYAVQGMYGGNGRLYVGTTNGGTSGYVHEYLSNIFQATRCTLGISAYQAYPVVIAFANNYLYGSWFNSNITYYHYGDGATGQLSGSNILFRSATTLGNSAYFCTTYGDTGSLGVATGTAFSAISYSNSVSLATFNSNLYLTTTTTLYSSTDGTTWTPVLTGLAGYGTLITSGNYLVELGAFNASHLGIVASTLTRTYGFSYTFTNNIESGIAAFSFLQADDVGTAAPVTVSLWLPTIPSGTTRIWNNFDINAINIYRTAGTATYYYVNSLSQGALIAWQSANPAVFFYPFIDTTTTATLTGGSTYPIGLTAGGTAKTEVIFSDVNLPLQYPYTNSFLAYPDDGDEITGLFEELDGLVIFKTKSICRAYTFGDVLNWSVAKLPDTHGCDEPWSIVKTPIGYLYSKEKQIYLFNGQSSMYISHDIQTTLNSVTTFNWASYSESQQWCVLGVTIGTTATLIVYDIKASQTLGTTVWYVFPSVPSSNIVISRENGSNAGLIITANTTLGTTAYYDTTTYTDYDPFLMPSKHVRTKTMGEGGIALMRHRKIWANYNKTTGQNITITLNDPVSGGYRSVTDSTNSGDVVNMIATDNMTLTGTDPIQSRKVYIDFSGTGLHKFYGLLHSYIQINRGSRG